MINLESLAPRSSPNWRYELPIVTLGLSRAWGGRSDSAPREDWVIGGAWRKSAALGMVCAGQGGPPPPVFPCDTKSNATREARRPIRSLFPSAVSMLMSTYILVRCPICRCSLNVRRVYIGKTVACRYCDQAFVIRLGEERIAVQFPDPAGRPLQAPEADPGSPPPWNWASDDLPSMVIDVRGAWDPESDRSLAVTRTEQGPCWPGVEVVQVDLGSTSPPVVTLFASELQRLRSELDNAGSERDRLREQAQRLHEQRQADELQKRRLQGEIEAGREALERIDAERRAALNEADQYQVALDKLGRSLCEAQSRHEAACIALSHEYAEARDRWERDRREEETRREEQRVEHARQLAAAGAATTSKWRV